jgi:hypothetical protein
MKVKLESEKIVKAVKKLDGIEIEVVNPADALEALNLILRKSGLFQRDDYKDIMEVNVTSVRSYETSAVDYKVIFNLEFHFKEDIDLDTKVATIKDLQNFFNKV